MKKFFLFLFVLLSLSAANAQEDTLKQYTGKYKFPEGSPVAEVTITLESGILTATSAIGTTELRKTEGDTFEIVAYGGTAIFKRNTEGKITGVQLLVGDLNIEGTKTEGMAYSKSRLNKSTIYNNFITPGS